LKLNVGSLSGHERKVEFEGFAAMHTRERIGLAMRMGVLFLLAAGMFVFVPALHFFLVPLCLVLAPVMAWISFRKTHWFPPPQTMPCLDCQKNVELESQYVEMPYKISCRECGARLTIYPP